MTERKYNWAFAELCDRLNIVIQKIIFETDEKQKKAFIQERADIVHDIDLFIKEGVEVTGEIISAIMGLQIVNITIWENEDFLRKESQSNEDPEKIDWKARYERVVKSHKLNANRSRLKAFVQNKIGGRVDPKLNYISGYWDFAL